MDKPTRLVALDAFRGFTIAGMIMVNTPGSWKYIYAPLRHASWHGCTPTDLVFPFFLFIVGVSMYFSFGKYDYKLTRPAVIKIVKRTILIFLIGLGLNAFPFYKEGVSVLEFWQNLRIPGVLQRIALAYGAGAILCLLINQSKLLLTSVIILLVYWFVLYVFGGEHPYSLEGNFVRVVDIAIFGEKHIYPHYGIPFDPEGLLSTIPSIVTVIAGFLTGKLIYKTTDREKVVLNMLLLGLPAIFLGLLWDYVFPINKSLWTSSYMLYTAGLAWITLGMAIWLIDVKKRKTWSQPLVVFGANPMFVYVLSIIWIKIAVFVVRWETLDGTTTTLYSWLFTTVFQPFGNYIGSLMFAIAHIVVYWLILLVLYKKRIFIKI